MESTKIKTAKSFEALKTEFGYKNAMRAPSQLEKALKYLSLLSK